MMELVVTTGAIGRAKLQSNHQHQQTNTKSFLQAGCPSCCPTNSVKALKGKPHLYAQRNTFISIKLQNCDNVKKKHYLFE